MYGLTEDYNDISSAQVQTEPAKAIAGKAKPPAKPSKLIADNLQMQTVNLHSSLISTDPTNPGNPANNRQNADAVLAISTVAKNAGNAAQKARNTPKRSAAKPKQKPFGSNLNLDIYFDKELSLLAAREAREVAQSEVDQNMSGRMQVKVVRKSGICSLLLF